MKPAHDPWHDHERTHAVHTDVRQLVLGPGCYLRVRQVCGCGLCQQCSASAVACHSHFLFTTRKEGRKEKPGSEGFMADLWTRTQRVDACVDGATVDRPFLPTGIRLHVYPEGTVPEQMCP